MSNFSRSANQTLVLLAVDNIYLNKQGLELFAAVDRGDMSTAEAKHIIRIRSRAYGAASQTVSRTAKGR